MHRPTSHAAAGAHDDRYRLLVDAITDYAIYMLDRTGVVSSWNPGARRLKGYEEREILGHHFSEFYTPEDRAAGLPARALATAAREGRFEAEGWRVRKDGTRFWAYAVVDPIRDDAGRLIGFAKVTRDLTERKRAAEDLRRTEEQFRLLVQGVTDYAIFMLDASGRVSSWNAGAERIKGYRTEEILGQHFSVFYTPEDRAAGLADEALAVAAREGRFENERWRVRKDGTRFMAHVVIDPIRDDAGTLVGYAKITRDVTERVEAQRQLEAAREALFQSQKLEAIGQLTGGVAHDFNNLLAVILGGLELLAKRVPDDPRAHRILDNVMHAAERGASLTRRMLAFARRQDLQVEAVDLAALVEGMSDLLARSLGPRVAVRATFPPGLPAVSTDANQLETALLNLAVNARDAMPAGGSILFTAEPVRLDRPPDGLPPGDYVRLAVADDGEGMDEATLARAAEPFFTTKGVGKGTGLGLSMVHGLAAQSGGQLSIRSARGAGTAIEMLLPVAAGPVVRRPSSSSQDPAPGPETRLTVMAVDDDEIVLASTAAMLEDLGHRAVAMASGAEALHALAAGLEPDLVLTDQVMPEMTGLELARALASRKPGLPVVLATGYSELAPEAGADLPRLAKPFNQAELSAVLAEAVARRTPA